MDTAIDIRPAVAADAGIISRILLRSIRVGCSLDHRNEPLRLEAWTRTRSIEHVLPWLADPRLCLNLAHLRGKPAGVGMARDDGRILLCYVQPEPASGVSPDGRCVQRAGVDRDPDAQATGVSEALADKSPGGCKSRLGWCVS